MPSQTPHPEAAVNERVGAQEFAAVFDDVFVDRDTLTVNGRTWTGDVVLHRGPCARTYAPFVHNELPGELAKLRDANTDDIVSFVKNFGCLGFSQFAEPTSARKYHGGGGDPVPWIRAHASGVYICLALTEALQRKLSAAKLRELVDSFQGQLRGAGANILSVPINWTGPLGRRTPPFVARHLRAWIINSNLAGISRYVSLDDQGKSRSFFHGPTISVIYWHLANLLDGGIVKRCAADGCDGIFIQTDTRQRFCPKRWRQQESLCAARQRMRRHRPRTTRNKGTSRSL
jgi:hypothetical protein